MIIEFKTKGNNAYHNRKYLAIDTGAECYTTWNPRISVEGIEIKTSDYKELIAKLERLGYERKSRIM